MGTGLEILATTALVGSMAASTAGAIDINNNMKKQRTQQREAKKEVEQTKIAEENKQKELQDTYRNMKTNLYSGDINSIESNNGSINYSIKKKFNNIGICNCENLQK